MAVPTDFQKHLLDPNDATLRRWLPTNLQTLVAAEFSPRLVLTWLPYDVDDIFVTVDRDEQEIAVVKPATFALFAGVPPWQAIVNIETAAEDAALDVADLQAIEPNWLIGQAVDIQGSATVAAHIGTDRGLSAKTGLKMMPSEELLPGGTHPLRAGFIDYYGRNNDPASVMDANWQFRYRLRSFVDLGSDADPNWRYLQSMPTDLTSFMRPETPVLTVTNDSPITTANASLRAPLVHLKFYPPGTSPAGSAAVTPSMQPAFSGTATADRWEYRIVARRVLNVPIPTTGNAVDPVSIDVGNPLTLSTAPDEILDNEVDRAWPGHEPVFHYLVLVQQYKVGSNGEQLIRGFDVAHPNVGHCEFDVTIAAPSGSGTESEIVVPIHVS